MSKHNFDYDLICIGGGSASLACAKQAQSHGAKVAVVDFVKPTPMGTTWGLGGTCVNVGCIPKKHMHFASLLGTDINNSTYYGWEVSEDITINWEKLVLEIRSHIKSTNWVIKVELRTNNIDYYNGMASFVDSNTINVNLSQKSITLTGLYILIATGTRPIYPDIPGAKQYCITSDDLFYLKKPPGKTLIVGAGYVSLECGGFLNEFGFSTTIAVRSEILRNFDRDMVYHIVEHLKLRGVTFLYRYIIKSVERIRGKRLLVKLLNTETNVEESEIFDTVLLAVGRKPLLNDLNIAAINLAIDNDRIVINDRDETNVKNIFALGDVAKGVPNLTPVAVLSGNLLAKRLFNESTVLMDYKNVPTTIFTPLEYSCVGLTEEDAIETFGNDNLEIYHAYFEPLHFLITNRPTHFCYAKVITKRSSDEPEILGIHFIGPDAGVIMQGFAVSIKCGVTVKQLFSTVGLYANNASILTNMKVTKRSGLDPAISLYIS